jgi:hypothetical protein
MTISYVKKGRLRKLVALVSAATLLNYNFAFGLCADGTTFPSGGFVIGQGPVANPSNWSPGVFTGTAGSIFVPDNSTFENNDPNLPLTGGGHDWVFDQGSTLCKETYVGPASQPATGWVIPPNTPSVCVLLPIIKGGRVTNLGDVPLQGEVITPTCDPSKLSTLPDPNVPGSGPNPANTYFNQLGCSISHGVATTPQTATSFLFVAGIKGGLFNIPLQNVQNPTVGGPSGKLAGAINYYSDIPEGQKLTNAAVSPDGMFAMATSIRRAQPVFVCLNPLGDPGDPSLPINTNFFVPPAGQVKCMSVGNNALAVDLTTDFLSDNQPYFGGQRVVNTFNATPGSSVNNPVPSAWPQCIFNGVGGLTGTQMDKLKVVFNNHSGGHCGNAVANGAMTAALITQPQALIAHNSYAYTGPLGGTIVQFKLSVDPISGLTQYQFRTYMTGLSLTTGLGTNDFLQSLFVMSDPSAVGAAGDEVITKVTLCEDMTP